MTVIRIGRDGAVIQAKTDGEKRTLLGEAADEDLVLAAWPGEWSQDVFVVDDLGMVRLSLGLPRHRTRPRQADDTSGPRLRPDDRAALPRSGDIWSHLAELPGLPEGGQREVADKASGRWTADLAMRLIGRSDLDPEARRRLFADASSPQAKEFVASEHTTTAEAIGLLTRFRRDADVVEAALRRADTKIEAAQVLSQLSYLEAAKLWLEGRSWSENKHPALATAILPVVLENEAAGLPVQGFGADRYEKPALIRSIARAMSSVQRLDLLKDLRHGRTAQRAFLAGEELSDKELLACLPELLDVAETDRGGSSLRLVEYVQRFPRLRELAGDQLRPAFERLLTAGWSPVRAAEAGQWTVLITVAEMAETPDMIEALARAAVFDGRAPGQRWREPHRYQLVDLLVNNRKASDQQIRYVLGRLPEGHADEIGQAARGRSRLRRICAEIQAGRSSGPVPGSGWSEPPLPDLPTDEALSKVDDPLGTLRGLLRYRGRDRDRVIDHVLRSAYMTDEQAWRLPVQDIQSHPRYGPLLAAKIADTCGNSPTRWHVASESLTRSTQLLVNTLISRIEAV